MNGTAGTPNGTYIPSLRPKGARLLALDGGGVKGISSVAILDAIMEEVKRQELKTGISKSQERRKPCDYFDLAGGTSTGGLIALMLFRLKMDTDQCREAYHNLASQIFAPTFLWSRPLGAILEKITGFSKLALLSNAFWKGAQFSGGPLEKAIKDVVDKYDQSKGQDKYSLVNPKSHMMFMCATLRDEGESILLRSYQRPSDATPTTKAAQDDAIVNGIDIVSAARATSAAPMYLPEESYKGLRFWDGGVLNNNPVEQLYNTRYDLVDVEEAPPKVNCVISLGCGWTTATKPSFAVRMLNTVSSFTEYYLANTEAKHRDFERLTNRMNGRADGVKMEYFRLNCPCGNNRFDMADYRIMPKLEKITQDWLKTDAEARTKIRKIAEILASRE